MLDILSLTSITRVDERRRSALTSISLTLIIRVDARWPLDLWYFASVPSGRFGRQERCSPFPSEFRRDDRPSPLRSEDFEVDAPLPRLRLDWPSFGPDSRRSLCPSTTTTFLFGDSSCRKDLLSDMGLAEECRRASGWRALDDDRDLPPIPSGWRALDDDRVLPLIPSGWCALDDDRVLSSGCRALDDDRALSSGWRALDDDRDLPADGRLPGLREVDLLPGLREVDLLPGLREVDLSRLLLVPVRDFRTSAPSSISKRETLL
jgi:hypothetical protein